MWHFEITYVSKIFLTCVDINHFIGNARGILPTQKFIFQKVTKKTYLRVDKGKSSHYFKKDKGLHKITNIMNQI